MGGYILCRARGGFNNALNMLQLAVGYARIHKRTILVDFPVYAATDLDTLFDFSAFPVLIHQAKQEELQTVLDSVTGIEPPFYTSEHVLNRDLVGWNATDQRFTIGRKVPIFNQMKQYDDSILCVIDGCMAGVNGYALFPYLKFKPHFLQTLRARLEKLPSSYKSLHIRDTDKQTNWEEFLKQVQDYHMKTPNLPLLVCADTPSVKKRLVGEWAQDIIYSDAWMPETVRRNLHYLGITNAEILPDALCDMFLLALGSDFLESCPSSGYSKYIRLLRKNPPLLHKITGLKVSGSPPR
jgi:hypothetical protein